ncbi:MAG: restriction endonuclease subunit S [Pirellulaceae bacterium]
MTLSKLPRDWVSVPISELLRKKWLIDHMDGNHGSDYPRSEEFVESGVPYIAANSIQSGKVNFRLAKYLSVERAAQLRKGFAKDGDVLFAHNATVGPVALLRTPNPQVILGTSLTYYRCNPDHIEPLFLKCYLESHWFMSQYQRMMGQSTRNQVPITAQREFICILPPLPEQQKIAAILSTWDRAIELTEKLIVAKKKRKQALMQRLLTGKVRLRGFEGDWRHDEIGRYLEQCSSRIPSTTALPIYTSSRAGLKPQDEYYAGRTVTNDGEYGIVPKHHFVFRHMSDDGVFVFHINKTGGDIAVSKEYPVFRAINLDQDFLLAKLNHTVEFRVFAASQKAGGTRTRLYFNKLRLWKTLLPSLSEQRAIADVLNVQGLEIELLSRRLDALKRQKRGLMQQLLTGKVRVNVDGDMSIR